MLSHDPVKAKRNAVSVSRFRDCYRDTTRPERGVTGAWGQVLFFAHLAITLEPNGLKAKDKT